MIFNPEARCINCKHWDVERDGHFDAHPCKKLQADFCCSGDYIQDENRVWISVRPKDLLAGCIGGGGFETTPNFGCVLFEAKS